MDILELVMRLSRILRIWAWLVNASILLTIANVQHVKTHTIMFDAVLIQIIKLLFTIITIQGKNFPCPTWLISFRTRPLEP
jgi:hypothetical protein